MKDSVSSSLISISGGEELFERTLEERERERERATPTTTEVPPLFVFARRFARALFFKEGENKRERHTHTENEER